MKTSYIIVSFFFFLCGATTSAAPTPSPGVPGLSPAPVTATPAASNKTIPASDSEPSGPAGCFEGYIRRMTGFQSIDAEFTETKQFQLMSEPLVSRGRLHLDRKPSMIRTVQEPYREILRFQKDSITIEHPDTGRTETFSPEQVPVLKLFFILFSGNRTALEHAFRIHCRKTDGGYSIELSPLDPSVNRLIRTITVDLDDRFTPYRIRYEEPGGDTTDLQLQHIRINPGSAGH